MIDPGHGGHDQGTEGPHGLLEKELVLDVAQRVGKLIEDRMGAEVIYTRTDDTFIPLEGRTALANDKKADLFLSIHANSSPFPRIAGIETYYLNFNRSRRTPWMWRRAKTQLRRNPFSSCRTWCKKITLHDKAEESREFAGRMQAALYRVLAAQFPGAEESRREESAIRSADRRENALRAGRDRLREQSHGKRRCSRNRTTGRSWLRPCIGGSRDTRRP